jgi:(R)-2-hydroxyacyl-CoA dehydratese activating ATPase
MAFTAGIDIGSATSKVVLLNDADEFLHTVISTGHNVPQAIEKVYAEALSRAGQTPDKIKRVVATGYGRRMVKFADQNLTEIICHAAGARWLFPETRTVIDIGGQDSKVIGLNERGKVTNFVMNDKCAAGTGRFLEVMARVMEVEVNEIGLLSLGSKKPSSITNICTVFAESEIISLRAEGEDRVDILAGLHDSIARRIVVMGNSIGFRAPITFSGGVAKNEGVEKALAKELGMSVVVPEEPQIVGALGAAVLAKQKLKP